MQITLTALSNTFNSAPPWRPLPHCCCWRCVKNYYKRKYQQHCLAWNSQSNLQNPGVRNENKLHLLKLAVALGTSISKRRKTEDKVDINLPALCSSVLWPFCLKQLRGDLSKLAWKRNLVLLQDTIFYVCAVTHLMKWEWILDNDCVCNFPSSVECHNYESCSSLGRWHF